MACRWECCDGSNRLQWCADSKNWGDSNRLEWRADSKGCDDSNRLQSCADGKVMMTVTDYSGKQMGKL